MVKIAAVYKLLQSPRLFLFFDFVIHTLQRNIKPVVTSKRLLWQNCTRLKDAIFFFYSSRRDVYYTALQLFTSAANNNSYNCILKQSDYVRVRINVVNSNNIYIYI